MVLMTPRVRALALTLHVTSSVSWIGAALVFLVLAIHALVSDDPRVVRGAYLLMEPAAKAVLMPLALAALVSGVVMSLGTRWGLIKHYWVVAKLGITVFSTLILFVYLRTFESMARAAASETLPLDSVRNPSPVLHAALALVFLVVATVLAIYKPRGITPLYRTREE